MVTRPARFAGFTLIEAVMVIVITGILAAIVSVFIKTSFDSYADASRRAELTDAADVALRRLAREVRLAVPNSLRLTDSNGTVDGCASGYTCLLEFIPTKDGGRYRNNGDGSSSGNFLCSGGTVNATFDVLGTMPSVAVGDFLVVDNDASLSAGSGCSGQTDVYCGGSRATVTGVGASSLTVGTPFANSTVICTYSFSRFQVVDQNIRAVTYACPSSVAGTMTRYWSYAFSAGQSTSPSGSSTEVVRNTTCSFKYEQSSLSLQSMGLLSVSLTVGNSSGESVTLFRELHVDNTP